LPNLRDHVDDALDLGSFVDSLPPVDAPRRPIFADRELGAPFMSDEALATVAPLAVTPPDNAPEMVPEIPEAEVVPEPALALEITEEAASEDAVLDAPLDVAEFDLPPVADEPEPISGESSIDTLIRRLEAGMARRAGPPPRPNPTSPAANPLSAMRDLMGRNRETEAQNDIGSARALDTLQRLAVRRMAG
jgi:hypothetical protein